MLILDEVTYKVNPQTPTHKINPSHIYHLQKFERLRLSSPPTLQYSSFTESVNTQLNLLYIYYTCDWFI